MRGSGRRLVGGLGALMVAVGGVTLSGPVVAAGDAPAAAPTHADAPAAAPRHADAPVAGFRRGDLPSTRELTRGLRTSAGPTMAAAPAAPAGRPTITTLKQHVNTSCSGTTDGHRVQAIYAVEADDKDRYGAVRKVILNELAVVDDTFAVSAAKTGGGRRVRWVLDAACRPLIAKVVVPAGALGTTSDGFATMTAALKSAGYIDTARKYLVFADAAALCAIADLVDDESATDNQNDNGAFVMFARVDAPCWVTRKGQPSLAAHELTHTLGGVQRNAPHATPAGHCTEDYELMCYRDADDVTTHQTCSLRHHPLLDCGGDDYFNTAPQPGSYLDQKWNVARSSFLDVVDPLPPTVWPALGARR